MNININDIKNGMTIIIDGNLCQIVEFQHVKPGKGSAFVRMKLKNLRTGAIVENSYNTNIKIERAHVEHMPMQFLYANGDSYVFMNTETYDQMEVPGSKLENEKKFLKEGLEIQLQYTAKNAVKTLHSKMVACHLNMLRNLCFHKALVLYADHQCIYSLQTHFRTNSSLPLQHLNIGYLT